MRYQKTSQILALVFTILFSQLVITGCGVNLNIFPVSKDVKLGKDMDKEILEKKKEYPILKNQEATNYLQNMVDELLKSPAIKYKDQFNYEIKIIDDDEIINAFCVPGGYIYVYTGLLKMIDYESTLAGVIAHEIGHVENRHATQRLTKMYGISVLAAVVKEQTKDQEGASEATDLLANMAVLNNSRSDEYEADKSAFAYLQSSKWYSGGIKMFFDKLRTSADGSQLQKLFSTHPLPKDRVDAVNQMLKDADVPPPTEKNLRYKEYKKFKELLF